MRVAAVTSLRRVLWTEEMERRQLSVRSTDATVLEARNSPGNGEKLGMQKRAIRWELLVFSRRDRR